jgi:four helix bundle protein
MVARNHKELICWQLCAQVRSLGLNAIRKGRANGDWDFRGQMRRAMRSNCYQTSEGFYAFKHKPFAHYLDGAYASLGETLDQIDDGHENGYFSDEQQTEMRRLARRAMKANRRLAAWLRSHPDPPASERPRRPARVRPCAPSQPGDHLGHA